jgi:hypothetical protein
LDELQVLDGLEEEKALCDGERKEKVVGDLGRATILEVSWRQKSRALWLRDGYK